MDRSGVRAAEKKEIRAAALERRDSLSADQRRDYSGRIIKTLTSLPCYQNADAVLTYVSFRSEVNTFPLLEQALADKKAVFAPKVLGREMDFCRIFSRDDLSPGYRGILEPSDGQLFEKWKIDRISQPEAGRQEKPPRDKEAGKRIWEEKPVDDRAAWPHILICLPGAAFDRARHRIGYGGGFYDRYLNRFLQDEEETDAAALPRAGTSFTTVALAYSCQMFEEIPWEPHDICPMCVVTEREIFR